jgi:hypothetical protein
VLAGPTGSCLVGSSRKHSHSLRSCEASSVSFRGRPQFFVPKNDLAKSRSQFSGVGSPVERVKRGPARRAEIDRCEGTRGSVRHCDSVAMAPRDSRSGEPRRSLRPRRAAMRGCSPVSPISRAHSTRAIDRPARFFLGRGVAWQCAPAAPRLRSAGVRAGKRPASIALRDGAQAAVVRRDERTSHRTQVFRKPDGARRVAETSRSTVNPPPPPRGPRPRARFAPRA